MESFSFLPFPTLQSNQLILRQITPDDALQILELRSNTIYKYKIAQSAGSFLLKLFLKNSSVAQLCNYFFIKIFPKK